MAFFHQRGIEDISKKEGNAETIRNADEYATENQNDGMATDNVSKRVDYL